MPSNPRNRPVISTGQNRMAPSPSGRAPMLPPSPSSPRTLPIDDFIQISDAARANMGEEVVTDLQSFMDRAGYTQTTGSFRITEGGVEMASVPRQSINGQVNVYVGSMGDEVVEANLARGGMGTGEASYAGGVQLGARSAKGIEGTAGINRGTGQVADVVQRVESNWDGSLSGGKPKLFGTMSHEITHATDMVAGGYFTDIRNGYATGLANPRISQDISESMGFFHKLIEEGVSPDQAFEMSRISESVEAYSSVYGSSEALADTGQISALRRVAENDPELARRLGLDDASEFTMKGQTRQRTLKLDILDKSVGNKVMSDESIASAYTLGGFKSGFDMYGLTETLREAGVSEELLEESSARQRVISAATYAARVGGFEEGSEELELLDNAAKNRGSYTLREEYVKKQQGKLELGTKKILDETEDFFEAQEKMKLFTEELEKENPLQDLYDEVYERERAKGRFNVDVVDDTIDDVSEIVASAGADPQTRQPTQGRPRLQVGKDGSIRLAKEPEVDQIPMERMSGRVVQASVDDAAEYVARRIPPQPVLEVGSGKATRKTLQRIVESGMTAKRVIRSVI